VASEVEAEEGRHLIWRVRLLEVSETELLVEAPSAIGKPISLDTGVEVVAVLAIGQNRWMFRTEKLGDDTLELRGRHIGVVRLRMPDSVERCQRRNFYRVETAELRLPEVEIWPLLDPKSVVLAERDNEVRFQSRDGAGLATEPQAEVLMPDVGPQFRASLLNIGGGGLGLDVRPQDSHILGRHKLYWIRFALPPDLSTPICATAKLAHSHQQSNQHVYAGMAFDFSFNPGHQRFVVEQICRYVAIKQRAQLQRRRSA
jgi:c-di-GMP-binding flagellar brake protein YcgR